MYLVTKFAYNIKEMLDFFKKIGYYNQQNYKKTKKTVFCKKYMV